MNARHLGAWLAVFAVAAVSDATSAVGANTNEPLTRTVSVTGQFYVYAANPALPSAVCVLAERVKSAWRDRLAITNQWRDPIVIAVRQRDTSETNAPAVRTEIFQTELHLRYQINCLVPPPIDEPDFVAAVVEALCAETGNRDQPIYRGKPYVTATIPPWLSCGLAQSIVGRADMLLDDARRSLDAGRPQSGAELMSLTALPPEPAARRLFQANAWLFTEALVGVGNGSLKMQRFLSELAATKSVSNAFWSVYQSDFPGPVALEKWWSVERARRVASVVAENLNLDQTAAQLGEILITTLAKPTSKHGGEVHTDVPLAQLWRYYEQPWLKPLLIGKLNSLHILRGSAHPLYGVVIEQYCSAIELLIDQQLVRFQRTIARADRSRTALERRRQQITQYLDGAERVYAADELAGIFRGYFRTLDQFEVLERQRSNPISDYVDKFDH